jgi:hypothetical protein
MDNLIYDRNHRNKACHRVRQGRGDTCRMKKPIKSVVDTVCDEPTGSDL